MISNYLDSKSFNEIIDIFKNDGAFKGKSKDSFNSHDVQTLARSYVDTLLNSDEPKMMWGYDAENYYFQMATHSYCAGLCIARWWNDGTLKVKSAKKVLVSDDSILLANILVPINNEFMLEMVQNIRFDQFKTFIGNEWEPTVDNTNEKINSGLIAFFLAGAAEDITKYE